MPCGGFAKREGAGGIIVVNLFAWRSPEVKDLATVSDPVGSENDQWLEKISRCAARIVVAWGDAKILKGRELVVLQTFSSCKKALFCLGKNKSGSPKHPLYLSADTEFIPYLAPLV